MKNKIIEIDVTKYIAIGLIVGTFMALVGILIGNFIFDRFVGSEIAIVESGEIRTTADVIHHVYGDSAFELYTSMDDQWKEEGRGGVDRYEVYYANTRLVMEMESVDGTAWCRGPID